MKRAYLDWNATAPLIDAARDAMVAAMDIVGNPSSVHAEGRGAKGIIERARVQVAEAFGANGSDIVFTSGATEAAALALSNRDIFCGDIEHDCVASWTNPTLPVATDGLVSVDDPAQSALQFANSETGVVQDLPAELAVVDFVQGFGKMATAFDWSGAAMGLLSAHKLGGPKGVGALVIRRGLDVTAQITGGGQEQGRRSGTENVIGIAGFGAAAEVAAKEQANGVWDGVAELRDMMEAELLSAVPDLLIVGNDVRRLPNTSCFAVPGWKGETQVMQMDLAGYAISAGSACSSGKVKASRVLKAMGYDDMTAGSAIRVSIGPATAKEEVMGFVHAWTNQHKKFRARAA